MTGTKATAAAAAILLCLGLTGPAAGATTARGTSEHIPADQILARAPAVLQALERGVHGAGVAPAIAALLHAPHLTADVVPAEIPAAPPASRDPLQAVARLDAAVRGAVAALGLLPSADVTRAGAAFARAAADRREGPVLERAGYRLPLEGTAPPLEATTALHAAAAAAPAAALAIAGAIDAALPALQGWTPPALGAAPCDVVDQPPYLCVASDQPQVHTRDYALTIDLGGDDEYRAGAGAAPFLLPTGEAYVPVAVVVDLAGDDTYQGGTAIPALPGWVLAQGVGAFGAIGFLHDAGGDDRYSAQPGAAGALAQGAAVGGVGLLADAAGSDTYTLRAPDGTGDNRVVVGQGAAQVALPGTGLPAAAATHPVGALVDRGAGDDRYLLDAGTVTGPGGGRSAFGQGTALLGVGVLADDGGADAVTAAARSRMADLGADPFTAPQATVVAQGVGSGLFWVTGLGAVLAGDGDTTFRAHAWAEGRAGARVTAQGYGSLGGFGAIVDRGGDDSYDLRATTTGEERVIVDDACTSEDGPCRSAEVEVLAATTTVSTVAMGQGMGNQQGAGYVLDAAGDDAYTASSLQSLDVTLEDRLSRPEAPPSLSTTAYAPSSLYAQGASQLAGAGALTDLGGTDAYTFTSRNAVTASATSLHAAGPPEVRALGGDRAFVGGQGAVDFIGVTGSLTDLGGEGDRVEARVENPTVTAPDPSGARRPGRWLFHVQGAFGGALTVAGDRPAIFSHPSKPVCVTSQGARGFGQWQDCMAQPGDPDHEQPDAWPLWSHHTNGFAPGARGLPVDLGFTAKTATTAAAGTAVPVEAALRDAAGTPMPGQTVHVSLQVRDTISEPTGGTIDGLVCCWASIWEVDATTGADGLAAVLLPTEVEGGSTWCTSCRFRLLVTFDGVPGSHPGRAASPLTLSGVGAAG